MIENNAGIMCLMKSTKKLLNQYPNKLTPLTSYWCLIFSVRSLTEKEMREAGMNEKAIAYPKLAIIPVITPDWSFSYKVSGRGALVIYKVIGFLPINES